MSTPDDVRTAPSTDPAGSGDRVGRPDAAVPAAYRPAPDEEPGAPAVPGERRRQPTEEKSRRKRRLEYPPAPEPLTVPVVDNHTHLDFRDGLVTVDVHQAMDAAAAAGVSGAVQVGCDVESARFTLAAIEAEPRLLGAVAIHPNDAARLAERGHLEAALEQIEQMAAHPRVRAVGETGLDYYRTGPEGVGSQQEAFRWHLDLAHRLGKAVQIHDRDAHEDVVRILLDTPDLPEKVVFHCFSGDAALARTCNEHGWYMSFAGPVTFAANDDLRAALAEARKDLVLVETDAPFLTPHPHRGRPNAPYLVPLTVRRMAEVRGMEVDALSAAIAANTRRVYGEF
ncbi:MULTISPECIES: TatD family hydrolase [Micrococcaceae]|uniref:TatD family hydrolase n=1 Tax=Micrococcaceae TaxID=1268 RepID=UPI0017EF5F15|nr:MULTISPECIES: TatD family hydrolase [Micrococcaceae]MBB5748095.1 TatD DNase family protein [Micrococcus sp. TA1]HRO30479.1 TatD family hydrolase [Citricoccus sp.]HRO92574.1 TatD family hydrolase [Citricoccus sp.]